MLTIEDLNVRRSRGREWLLRRFNLHVQAGTCCALVGHSGAGKTAVLEAIMGLRPCESGKIRVGPTDGGDSPAIRRQRTTAIWGSGAVDDGLTVRQNISLILQVAGSPRPAPATTNQLLRVMELPDRRIDQSAAHLTSAERLSMWLTVARLRDTPLLLLDEPTAAFTISGVNNLIPIIRELRASGMTIVLATRDTDLACALADRISVIDEGRTLAEGSPGVVFGLSATDRPILEMFQP